MRTVVAVPDNRARERIAGLLRARGFEVTEHSTFPITRHDAGRFDADLVIALSRDIELIRNANLRRRPFIIAALPIVNDSEVNEALKNGADDLMAVNACSAEIVARAEMPDRLRLFEGKGQPEGIERLEIWQDAPRILSQDVGAIFGVFMNAEKYDDAAPQAKPDVAASIRLASAADEAVIQIFVGVSDAEGERLANHVFGGPIEEDVLRDALREISNNLAGSFKRAALTEGTTVTVGLPTDCRATDLIAATRVWTAECEHFSTVVGISQVNQFTKRVKAADLLPGMVLKHDIRTAAGAALVRAGTALTDRTASHLLDFCDPSAMLEVIDIEAADAS